MTIEIEKVKLSGESPHLLYKRLLPSGLEEECKLTLKPVPAELDGAMQALLGDCIEIIGLDSERWDDAGVAGLTLKPDNNGMGFVATLVNREEDSEGAMAIVANTPYLNSVRVANHRDLDKKLTAVVKAAVGFITTQPEQLDLLEKAA